MVTLTRELLDEFREKLALVTKLNDRIAALEQRGDGTAYEREVREKIRKGIDEVLKEAELIQRIERIETMLSRLDVAREEQGRQMDPEQKAWHDDVLKYIATGYVSDRLAERFVEKAERKDLTVNVSPTAGYLVPPEFHAQVIEAAREFDPVRQLATVRTTSAGEVLWPKRTGVATASYLGSETGPATESTGLAFGQVSITPKETMTFVDVSRKQLRTSAIDLEQYIVRQFGEAFEALWGESYINGDTPAEPHGFLKNADVLANYVASGNASDLDSADPLIKVQTKLKKPYWANAAYLMNRNTLGKVWSLSDSTGRPLFGGDISDAVPLRIRGKPVYIAPSMPDVAADAYPVAYGDFRRGYTIVDAAEMSILRDEVTQAATALVRIYAYGASGGDVTDDEAIAVVKIATS